MSDFDFHDRTTWLAFRADWRLRYAKASEEIRAMKRELSALHAERRADTSAESRVRIDYRINSLQEILPWRRRAANALMVERMDAAEHKDALLAAREQIAA